MHGAVEHDRQRGLTTAGQIHLPCFPMGPASGGGAGMFQRMTINIGAHPDRGRPLPIETPPKASSSPIAGFSWPTKAAQFKKTINYGWHMM